MRRTSAGWRRQSTTLDSSLCWIAPVNTAFPMESMALKSTIFKASLNISNIDRGYYAEHGLTLARHPSDFLDRQICSVN